MTDRTGHNIIQRAGQAAALPFPVHPYQLHHACDYYLTAKGHDTRASQAYLGHRNIQHTVKYTELSRGRFEDFWQE
jgi:type 1 fimbriae regulatory protein FimB/type 1 fimbriae regulatory protein FimE